MAYQRGNQRDGYPRYSLLNLNEDYSEDGDKDYRNRRITRRYSASCIMDTIEFSPESNDTLRSLAVQYGCTISQLKRINKIHRENEIYTRPSIKIPIKPCSLVIPVEKLKKNSEDNNKERLSIPKNKDENHSEYIELLGLENLDNLTQVPAEVESPKSEINTIILKSDFEPLSIYNSNSSLEILNTECDTLLSPTENETGDNHLTDTFKCSGDDCGLPWTQLLGFFLLLGFAGPIIYILYVA